MLYRSGIVGAGLGFALGAAAAAGLAPALGIPSFDGALGYFAVFVGGPIGALFGLVLGTGLALRRAGFKSFGALAGRVAAVGAGVIGVCAAVLAGFWIMRPVINTIGLAPQLIFEIRLPPSAAPSSANGYAIELQTSKKRMLGSLELPRLERFIALPYYAHAGYRGLSLRGAYLPAPIAYPVSDDRELAGGGTTGPCRRAQQR